jgi:hypothetical protein
MSSVESPDSGNIIADILATALAASIACMVLLLGFARLIYLPLAFISLRAKVTSQLRRIHSRPVRQANLSLLYFYVFS